MQSPWMTVVLGGPLAAHCGGKERHQFTAQAVRTVRDAVSALDALYPGFRALVARLGDRVQWRVTTPYFRDGLDESQLDEPLAGVQIVIRPAFAGAGGTFRVIAGLALIAVAVAVPFAAAGGGTLFGLLGASLLLGAFMQPPKAKKERKDERRSSAFSQITGTGSEYDPIPLLLGGPYRVVRPSVVSGGITTYDI